jgi:hypothetical protein
VKHINQHAKLQVPDGRLLPLPGNASQPERQEREWHGLSCPFSRHEGTEKEGVAKAVVWEGFKYQFKQEWVTCSVVEMAGLYWSWDRHTLLVQSSEGIQVSPLPVSKHPRNCCAGDPMVYIP